MIWSAGQLLACRRIPSRGGRWEFPGGKVEPSETPEHALAREIREELGVGVTVGAVITVYESAELTLTSYHAELSGHRPTSSTDHDALEWLNTDELDTLDWSAADLPTVRILTRSSNRYP